MLQITEDTPPDMLAGAMDLSVHLPSGQMVKMSVERSTPMMDLLVQITTNHHLQLSNYTLQALSMAPSSEHSEKILPFKPNTPIGALDTQHIRVMPKSKNIPVPKNIPPGHQPFESTFRLRVHLPRNQLYVTRVSRNVLLEDIMMKVCEEKNLDPVKFEFKHPGNLDDVLDPKLTLSDYQITEIYVVQKGSASVNQAFSTNDIMALRKEEERKQMHNKTGGGVFNLIFRRGKSSMGSGSISSDNRSISPTHSDDSRSVTPPGVQQPIIAVPKKEPPPERPKPPQRKRRPAPKPPQTNDHSRKNSTEKPPSNISDVPNDIQLKTAENSLTICHSRNSSDSSGYHEASILSDNCNTSLPRRPKSALVSGGDVEKMFGEHSQSTTNLSKMSSHSKSTTSLISGGRKKKAAPPPPPPVIRAANSVASLEKPSPLVASQPAASHKESIISANLATVSPSDSTVAANLSVTSSEQRHLVPQPSKSEEKSIESNDSGIVQESEKRKETADLRAITPPPPPIVDDIIQPEKQETATGIVNIELENKPFIRDLEITDIDWQYQLPAPPKAFRDSSPANYTHNKNEDIESVNDLKTDSVVTSPELFEKLKVIEDNQSEKDTFRSEITSTVSEVEKPLNTLSLEILEKRKSLVYNRELATSLKMTEVVDTQTGVIETFSSSLTKFESTYEDIRRSSLPKQPEKSSYKPSNTLPNFKITTYDEPKQKIKVFEDDTVRSNTDHLKSSTVIDINENNTINRSHDGRPFENITTLHNCSENHSENDSKEKDYKFYKAPKSPFSNNFGPASSIFRSESFSTDNQWSSSKPVSRSKSHLTLTNYREEKYDVDSQGAISKSNSLFDVSGLQSLGVMKLIQNKLNTPTTSMENISQREKSLPHIIKSDRQEDDTPKQPANSHEKPTNYVAQKTFKYRGPPSINMGTWSERPKVPVSVKEDADYKHSNISSKLIVNTINNNITSNNSVEVKGNGNCGNIKGTNSKVGNSSHNVSVRVNGTTDQITQNPGNVVIKIGGYTNLKPVENQQYVTHTTAPSFRKPFANIDRNQPNLNQRPHSIAFDSDFDISRVPVVRSVELKKPFKDIHTSNTSITQINTSDDKHRFPSTYRSNDTLANFHKSTHESIKESQPRPAFRINSFRPHNAPVVRGFKSPNDINNRLSWNPTNTFSTFPAKTIQQKDYITNKEVSFSQSNLRRTESNKISNTENGDYKATVPNSVAILNEKNNFCNGNNYNSLPSIKHDIISTPPPPQMPKFTLQKVPPKQMQPNRLDGRDLLLESIRNFGGKKGLKAAKA